LLGAGGPACRDGATRRASHLSPAELWPRRAGPCVGPSALSCCSPTHPLRGQPFAHPPGSPRLRQPSLSYYMICSLRRPAAPRTRRPPGPATSPTPPASRPSASTSGRPTRWVIHIPYREYVFGPQTSDGPVRIEFAVKPCSKKLRPASEVWSGPRSAHLNPGYLAHRVAFGRSARSKKPVRHVQNKTSKLLEAGWRQGFAYERACVCHASMV
jgi:hypothetical protein